MCDYSLQNVQSRPAKVGDKLTTYNFNSGTRGLADTESVKTQETTPVAVCLLPGTEVAFDEPVVIGALYMGSDAKPVDGNHRLARFRQVDKDQERAHHDALEFPDGQIVLLTKLREFQAATVLQLPATPKTPEEAEEQKRVEFAG